MPETTSRSPFVDGRIQVFKLSPSDYPGTLTGSWIRSGEAGTQTSAIWYARVASAIFCTSQLEDVRVPLGRSGPEV